MGTAYSQCPPIWLFASVAGSRPLLQLQYCCPVYVVASRGAKIAKQAHLNNLVFHLALPVTPASQCTIPGSPATRQRNAQCLDSARVTIKSPATRDRALQAA